MAFLSIIDHDVVTRHPLGSALDHLLKPLKDMERFNSIYSSLDGTDDRTEECRGTVSQLLHALIWTKAALNLRLNNRGVTVELAALLQHVNRADFNY